MPSGVDTNFSDADDHFLGQEWSYSSGENGYRIEKPVTITDEPLFLDLNQNGTASETGLSAISLLQFFEKNIYSDGSGEEYIMYRTTNGENLGGYMVRNGYQVVLDNNGTATGQMVSSTGQALNVFTDLLKADTWTVDQSTVDAWASANSQTGTPEEFKQLGLLHLQPL